MDSPYFEKLIMEGAIEFAGVDSSTGEMLYSFTDRLEVVAPEIFSAYNEDFYRQVMYLWERGFLNIDVRDSNPAVTLTPAATDPERTRLLSPGYRLILEQIVKAFFGSDEGV